MKLSEDVGRRFRELVALRLGLAFQEARQTDLERGLLRACRSSRLLTPERYVEWLATLSDQSPEWKRLASHLTVGETYFFRDPSLFEALEHQILPDLIAARRSQGMLQLRLWSAGCATGEEPYSLAIILDRLLPDRSQWALTLLATDINLEALHVAEQGVYRQWSFRNTPEWVRTRHFHYRDRATFEVAPGIRQAVVFAPLNLNDGSYPSVVTNTVAMDLVLCRNVLMYFTPQAQRATVARLQEALVIGGWLVVSAAEASAELLRPLVPVQCSGAILYHKEGPQLPRLSRQEEALLDFSAQRSAANSPAVIWDAKPSPSVISAPQPEVNAEPEAGAGPAAERENVPIDTAGLLRRARDLADQGQLDDARRLCDLALAQDQLDPDVHVLIAAICQECGEVGAAVEALRKAVYLDPDSAPAHFLLGSLLLRQGERRRGRRSMETAVGLLSAWPRDEVVPGTDGLSAGPLLEMARAYLELGR